MKTSQELLQIIIQVAERDEFYVEGVCNNPRREDLIEESITALQTNPEKAFKDNFVGFKNYAGFGDQRCDCSYGHGPRHGSIVFEIGRGKNYDPENAKLYIDFLLVARDFPGVELKNETNNYSRRYGLTDVIRRYLKHKSKVDNLLTKLKESVACLPKI